MPDSIVEKSFCTTREAADALGVSVGTVQLWVESGLLQAWKTAGGHRRVMRDSVDSLLRKKNAPLPAAPRSPAVLADHSRRLSILVVDDDINLLRLYAYNMSRWPMAPQVIWTDSAISAMMKIGQSCPDLLIADLHMPGMDGFEMLRVLSSTPEMAATTIVAVTGLDPVAIELQGGIPPGIEVLPKPIPFDRLLTIATGIFSQSRFQSRMA